MAECEAVLLGREPIHGSANATALAALVKTLMRKSELHRKYILRCNRDNGLQMIPYRRLEDEGFESDEDLTSLGSYDSSSSMYVSDHALRVKCQHAAAAGRSSSQLSNADATSGSVSSVGTDSANSSGASDNDDTDNSLSHNVNHNQSQTFAEKKKADDVESFTFHEVAFCHTDPSLPKVIVWVVKTKRQSKITNEVSYGLEAIVFLCASEEKFRALYKNFQELSRRQKLDKPVRNRWKEECRPTTMVRKIVSSPKPTATADRPSATKSEAKSNAVMFNLVQRVDTDGVTHIEVTRPGPTEPRQPKMLSDGEPSSIISINTPDSGDVKTIHKKSDKLIESVIKTEDGKETPPERPERKKSGKSLGADKTSSHGCEFKLPNREKVVRGQYVRVSVDQKTLSSPTTRGGWLFSEAKPCGNVLSYPARLVWSRGGEKENEHEHRRSRKELERGQRHRSKSSVILRRGESPKRYPMSHRYVDAIHINNSLPNRFFGRLKELTGASLQPKFRRRNSIGDLTNANYYQQCEGKKFDKNHGLAKSTPNLKSMIKNKNGKFYKDGYNENEPKKVTFSAYATVQVVD